MGVGVGVVVVFGGFVCAVHGVVGVGEREGRGRGKRRCSRDEPADGEKERSGGRRRGRGGEGGKEVPG